MKLYTDIVDYIHKVDALLENGDITICEYNRLLAPLRVFTIDVREVMKEVHGDGSAV